MPDHLAQARVLFVCTGNVCRSPLAERLLLGGLAHHGLGGIEVSSAGTHALVGSDMTPPTAELVAELGGVDVPHTARQLTADLVRGADVVIALARVHRSAVVTLVPAALRRSFTLREVERLLAGLEPDGLAGLPVDPAERLRALVPLLLGSRGPVADPVADDVTDPYGGSRARYRLSADELAPAVAALAEALAPG